MPRRRPTQVRAHQRLVRQIPGVSAPALRAVTDLERTRLWPDAVADALDGWARFVRGPLEEYRPTGCLDATCQRADPAVCRETLRTAVHALPARAARELRALVEPLDETYLTRCLVIPSRLRDALTGTTPSIREHGLTMALDVDAGWLIVDIDDGRGARRLYASDLTFALDDLLDALISLTRGVPRARVSWEGEPTEYRWLCTVEGDRYARVRVLTLSDRSAHLPEHEGHRILDTDLPLRALVQSVTAPVRALLNRLGEDGYARRWEVSPFPTSRLLLLEHWLRE